MLVSAKLDKENIITHIRTEHKTSTASSLAFSIKHTTVPFSSGSAEKMAEVDYLPA